MQRDNINDTKRQVDTIASAIAPSLVFGAVALPPGLPDYRKIELESRAEQAKISAQEAGFVAADMSRAFDGKTIQERDKDEENRLYVASLVQEVEQRLERERQEWSRTSSTVSSVTMTGAEWAKLADRLRNDDDLRRRIMDVFEKRGMTKQEAEARYERVADIAEIAAIPPSQRTDEQKATMKQAEADPTLKRDMEDARQAQLGRAPARSTGLAENFEAAASSQSVATAQAVTPPASAPTVVPGMGF
ncbi:hypothetical protein WG908_02535 [Sphingobium sp. AN641]|uniref:hypothetical protein n=1 Tax=Sphingobium sp. AN641 TaxID=3133443 RepID=UPI0030BAEE8E